MKFQTLPVKRRPASKGIFRRLSAVTRSRKQRVAAASAADLEEDDGGSIISRALIIIFLFHIVVIGLIFIHQHFLDGRPAENSEVAKTGTAEVTVTAAAVAPPAESAALPSKEQPYIVKAGDSYARIATSAGVDENALRLLNKHVDISPGLILKIPPPPTAASAAPVIAIHTPTPPDRDRGLVDAAPVDVSGAPKAHLVRATGSPDHAAAAPLAGTGKSYVVQQGDSIWRIAHRSKVSQDVLLRANGISDARKIKPGMKLTIPQKENSKL
ncbi:MAG: LysM domain-containing protein [Verrucomicrobiota bacterium]